MKKFVRSDDAPAAEVWNDHGGDGPILFRRLLDAADFHSNCDFVDYTVVPPGSSIGRHEHHGNEEIYFIASGTPLMRSSGEEARLAAGSLAVVRNGEWHELINDTDRNVEILVVQVGL